MTMISDSRTDPSAQANRFGDLMVMGAITLVAAAVFAGAYLQFGVAFWLALVGGLGLYVIMMMLHRLYRRSERVDALVAEVSRLEGEIDLLRGHAPDAGSAAAPLPPPVPRAVESTSPQASDPKSRRSDATRALPAKDELSSVGKKSLPPPIIPDAKASNAAKDAPKVAKQPPSLPDWPGTSVAPDPMHDYWAFRPSKDPAGKDQKGAPTPPPIPAQAKQADLDSMQGVIDKLAGEVGLGRTPADGGDLSTEEQRASALKASVDALQSTANTMRAADSKPPPLTTAKKSEAVTPAAPPPAATAPGAPPPIAATHARLAVLADAISAGRVDVHAKPIARLADRQAEHYEVHVRLSDRKGAALAISPGDEGLAKTGLLPMLDSANLKRTAEVARSLAASGGRHSVFCTVAGESLGTDQFLDELANIYQDREEIAQQLVLTLTQSDVRTFGDKEWSTLVDMRDLGFRFALSEIVDADFDFQSLTDQGFAFAKLDAAVLLDGFSTWSGAASAGDFCRDLEAVGLTPIVDHINDPTTHARIAELGVRLGAGHHFAPSPRAGQPPKGARAGTAAA